MSDLYTVLGVARTADQATIRDAYRALARMTHPDVGGDETAMVRLNAAWHVVGSPERRAAYDAQIASHAGSPASAVPEPRGRRADSAILDFGRYQGWSVRDVAGADDDYLMWLARTPIGRPLRGEILAVLDERARAFDATRPVATATRHRRRLRR